jgi:hypothetical protein
LILRDFRYEWATVLLPTTSLARSASPRGSLPAIGPFAGPADVTDERDEGPHGEVVGPTKGSGYEAAVIHAALCASDQTLTASPKRIAFLNRLAL